MTFYTCISREGGTFFFSSEKNSSRQFVTARSVAILQQSAVAILQASRASYRQQKKKEKKKENYLICVFCGRFNDLTRLTEMATDNSVSGNNQLMRRRVTFIQPSDCQAAPTYPWNSKYSEIDSSPASLTCQRPV